MTAAAAAAPSPVVGVLLGGAVGAALGVVVAGTVRGHTKSGGAMVDGLIGGVLGGVLGGVIAKRTAAAAAHKQVGPGGGVSTTLTPADSGKTLTMAPGDKFLLNLPITPTRLWKARWAPLLANQVFVDMSDGTTPDGATMFAQATAGSKAATTNLTAELVDLQDVTTPLQTFTMRFVVTP
jgi:hypothetical protein